MKYTIHGFSQVQSIKFGLNCEDLLLLRWFIDFKESGNMFSKIIDGETYYWISYQRVAEDCPIVSAKKDTVYRKFKRMADLGILGKKTIRENGTFSYYNVGKNYPALLVTPFDTIDAIDKSKKIDESSVENSTINNCENFTPNNTISDNRNFPKSNNPSMDVNLYQNQVGISQKPANYFSNQLDISSSEMDGFPKQMDGFPKQMNISPEQIIHQLNTSIISNKNLSANKNLNAENSEEFLLAEYLFDNIKRCNPNIRKPNLSKWASVFAYMLNTEHRNLYEIMDLISWIYKDDNFWSCRILTANNLKNNYDRLIAIKNFEKKQAQSKQNYTHNSSVHNYTNNYAQSIDSQSIDSNPNIFKTQYGSYDLSGFECVG